MIITDTTTHIVLSYGGPSRPKIVEVPKANLQLVKDTARDTIILQVNEVDSSKGVSASHEIKYDEVTSPSTASFNALWTLITGYAATGSSLVQLVDAGGSPLLPGGNPPALTDGTQLTGVLDPDGNEIYPNGKPVSLTASFTRPADTTNYTAGDKVGAATANVKQKETISLTGSAPAKQKEILTLTGASGTAVISAAGTLTKTITFATGGTMDLAQTATDFYTDNAAFYLVEGITLTASTNTLVFEAVTAGTPIVPPVITPATGDLSGTVANSVANVVVGVAIVTMTAGLTRNVTWTGATIDTTAAAFVTDFAADYLALGVVVTSLTNTIIFEASVAGVPFTAPVITNSVGDLAGTVAHTLANVTIVPITFTDAVNINGGGNFLFDFLVETDAVQFASTTQRLWLYHTVPTSIVGDNVAHVSLIANHDKRNSTQYVDVLFDALLAGSDVVFARPSSPVSIEFVAAAASKNMYVVMQTLSAVTTPKSGGIFYFNINAIKL
jgi:hypothetical protein